jgi:hypothetical protein
MLPIKQVLCFGKDRSLQNTRMWLLDRLCATTLVMSLAEFDELAAVRRFDLVVLCHTLSADECHQASTIAREHWPQAKILGLTAFRTACQAPDLDASIAGLEGPEMLLQCASELLQMA